MLMLYVRNLLAIRKSVVLLDIVMCLNISTTRSKNTERFTRRRSARRAIVAPIPKRDRYHSYLRGKSMCSGRKNSCLLLIHSYLTRSNKVHEPNVIFNAVIKCFWTRLAHIPTTLHHFVNFAFYTIQIKSDTFTTCSKSIK